MLCIAHIYKVTILCPLAFGQTLHREISSNMSFLQYSDNANAYGVYGGLVSNESAMLLWWGIETNETSADVSSVSPSSERIRGHNSNDDNNIHVISNSTVSHLPFYPPLQLSL